VSLCSVGSIQQLALKWNFVEQRRIGIIRFLEIDYLNFSV